MRTSPLNRLLGGSLVALSLASCTVNGGDTGDVATTTNNTTQPQTDSSQTDTVSEPDVTSSGDHPTTSSTSSSTTTNSTPADPTTSTSTAPDTGDTAGQTETGVVDTGPVETVTTEVDTSTGGPDDTSTGGPDDTSTGGPEGLSFAADIYPNIVGMRCGCHVAGSGGLKMGNSAATAYAAMVDKKSSTALDYVEPGDSDASYMFHKITGTQGDVGGGGSQMPKGGPPLPQDQIDLIKQWIDEGALP